MKFKGFTHGELLEIFAYDSETGIMRWKVTRQNNALAGEECGTDNGLGYLRIRVKGKNILIHQLAFFLVYGSVPDEVDHRDTNTQNNRISNLRAATRNQNMGNTNRPINNRSGFKGVSFHRCTGKWCAQIGICGKRTHLGLRNTAEEAAALYREAARKHFGEFFRAA